MALDVVAIIAAVEKDYDVKVVCADPKAPCSASNPPIIKDAEPIAKESVSIYKARLTESADTGKSAGVTCMVVETITRQIIQVETTKELPWVL